MGVGVSAIVDGASMDGSSMDGRRVSLGMTETTGEGFVGSEVGVKDETSGASVRAFESVGGTTGDLV